MKLNLDRLPASVRRLADILGQDAALALVLHYGGRTLWPAKSGAAYAELAECLGETAAQAFVRHFREPVRIAKCDHATRAVVREGIRTEFDRLIASGYSANAAVYALAGQPPHRFTDRHIWRVLKRTDPGRVIDAGQAELF
ncbi:MAG: hypothetical protein ACOZB0_04685 [Pseudomonadota bacterium]